MVKCPDLNLTLGVNLRIFIDIPVDILVVRRLFYTTKEGQRRFLNRKIFAGQSP